MTQTVIIRGASQRQFAADIVARAPEGTVLRFSQGKRTVSQNARMWAMLSDFARQVTHEGETYSPEVWKCLFMQALGHEIAFAPGLNGEPFPLGFRSSRLTKPQMSDMMELIASEGARRGVQFMEPT